MATKRFHSSRSARTSSFRTFGFRRSANFTIGQYSEPANDFSASRANMAFVLGSEIAQFWGSDFQGTVNVNAVCV